MQIDSHKRTLAIIHLVLGILRILMYGGLVIFFSSVFPFIEAEIVEEEGRDAGFILNIISSAVFSVMAVAALFTAIPSIIGGIAVLQNKGWGMVLLLISGCISLLSFPIGTAVGVYSIWVFVENNKARKEKEKD